MDIQLFLNGMLPPFEKFNENLKADNNLTDSQRKCLYQIVDDCQQQKTKFNVDKAFDTIVTSFGSYFGKGKELPFLIKQVIFCLTVHCLEYKKKSQKEVLDYLKFKGVSITHNFFTRLGHTPTQYQAMDAHKIPKSVISYMGAKRGGLGIAIKNLVYQAGEYDTFYDIFGGSGAASLAVNKISKKNYIYNELNASVFNLIYVVKDDKLHLELIDALNILQNYLVNGGQQYGTMDLDEITQRYIANYKNTKDQYTINTGIEDFKTSGYAAVRLAYDVYNDIICRPAKYSVTLNKIKYTKKDLLDLFDIPNGASQELIDLKIFEASILHHRKLEEYNKKKINQAELIWESENGQVLKGTELNKTFKHGRAYSYYIYFFEEVLKQSNNIPNDRVNHAVAEIFRHYFAFSGRSDNNSVLSSLRSDIGRIDKFGKEDFKTLIAVMHEELKKITLKNEDFSRIFNNKLKNVLYYADPPYMATKGYEDKANNVGSFTGKDMEKLIRSLIESGHKFIYSCRAVKSKPRGKVSYKYFREGNLEIFEYVYNVFNDYIRNNPEKDFYVLVLESINAGTIDGEPIGTLKSAIKHSGIIELMITNFEICSFVSKECKDLKYKVYSFTQVLQLLMDYAVV